MSKTKITSKQAIDIVSKYACPIDFGLQDWDRVLIEGLKHVDGLAVALDIDNEYEIVY